MYPERLTYSRRLVQGNEGKETFFEHFISYYPLNPTAWEQGVLF